MTLPSKWCPFVIHWIVTTIDIKRLGTPIIIGYHRHHYRITSKDSGKPKYITKNLETRPYLTQKRCCSNSI